MGKLHLSFEELSALSDGELPAPAETSARQHLRECPECSAEYSLSVRLERDLRQPPVLSCDTALELISADFDGQAGRPDRPARHQPTGLHQAGRTTQPGTPGRTGPWTGPVSPSGRCGISPAGP